MIAKVKDLKHILRKKAIQSLPKLNTCPYISGLATHDPTQIPKQGLMFKIVNT